MNTRTLIYSFAMAMLPFTASGQDSAPSGDDKVTELSEIVVTGENVWIEGDKIVFKPQKSAKNLATDAASLIDNMHTGLLKARGGTITTNLGEQVTIFINGVRADNIDLSTFWPKNALRVEYMQSSDDPRFMGATNIVNFIMKEYVSGGLTKLNGFQQFPNYGKYSASSKLVYGKMTYNALVSGGYSRDHNRGSDETEFYDDVWYEGTRYDRIERSERSDDVSRNNNMYAGFNARYLGTNKVITHSVNLQWQENPESTGRGSTSYSPSIINTDWMSSARHSRSLSPSLSGNYGFDLSEKWSITADWRVSHSHNNNFSSFTENDVPPIENRAVENMFNYSADLTLYWRARENSVFIADLTENRNVSTIDYSGSATSRQWQQSGTTLFKVRWWWRPVSVLTFDITPQITLSDWNVNHTTKKTEWLPGISGRLNWRLSSKIMLGGNGYYEQYSPGSSVRTDLMLRQTELKWLEGNPDMGSSKFWTVGAHVYASPISWFNTYLSVSYHNRSGEGIVWYRPGGQDYDGVIGQYMNIGSGQQVGLYWEGNVSLLNNRLNIGDELEYTYEWYDNEWTRKVGSWRNAVKMSYTFGNCRVGLIWYTPRKSLSNGGTTVKRSKYGYSNIYFSYGNGNFNFSVQGSDLLHKYNKETIDCYQGAYGYSGTNWSTGRNVNISVTYTFDYGKKVDPSITIREQNIGSSAILGTE